MLQLGESRFTSSKSNIECQIALELFIQVQIRFVLLSEELLLIPIKAMCFTHPHTPRDYDLNLFSFQPLCLFFFCTLLYTVSRHVACRWYYKGRRMIYFQRTSFKGDKTINLACTHTQCLRDKNVKRQPWTGTSTCIVSLKTNMWRTPLLISALFYSAQQLSVLFFIF